MSEKIKKSVVVFYEKSKKNIQIRQKQVKCIGEKLKKDIKYDYNYKKEKI